MVNPACWLFFWLSAVTPDSHIQWHFSSIQETKSEWKLVFTAKVDRGWHLYSQWIEEFGPMPTSFTFEKGNFELLDRVNEAGDAKTSYDSTFMMNVVWYENEVVFTQRVRAKSKVNVSGVIEYSVCSEERCIPGSVRFNIDAGF